MLEFATITPAFCSLLLPSIFLKVFWQNQCIPTHKHGHALLWRLSSYSIIGSWYLKAIHNNVSVSGYILSQGLIHSSLHWLQVKCKQAPGLRKIVIFSSVLKLVSVTMAADSKHRQLSAVYVCITTCITNKLISLCLKTRCCKYYIMYNHYL